MNGIKHHLIVFIGTLFVCFVCGSMRKWTNVRREKYCTETMIFPLWYKFFISVTACFIPVGTAILTAIGKSDKGNVILISILAVPMGYLLLTTWTTRVRMTGTDLLVRNVFFSRHMDINLIREISKSEWRCSYKIIDAHGKKIWLSYYLSGVDGFIRRVTGTHRNRT